jgi:hypothetical protein
MEATMPAPQATAGSAGIAALRRGDGSFDIDFGRRRARRLRHAARSLLWRAALRRAAEAFAAVLSARGSDAGSAGPAAVAARCAPADA